MTKASPNHALQRARPSRSGCIPRVPWAGSLSLGRWLVKTKTTATPLFMIICLAVRASAASTNDSARTKEPQTSSWLPSARLQMKTEPLPGTSTQETPMRLDLREIKLEYSTPVHRHPHFDPLLSSSGRAAPTFSGHLSLDTTGCYELFSSTTNRSLSEPSQPSGAVNGSQPIRSDTNRTSSAAGSRR